MNDGNNEDSYKEADIARTWNSNEDMFEGGEAINLTLAIMIVQKHC